MGFEPWFTRPQALAVIRNAGSDWRLSKEIAEIQARAAAEALYPKTEELDGEDLSTAQIAQDPQAGKDAWINMATGIMARAILDENRKHYDEIQSALAKLRENAMTDEEIEDLTK